MPFDLERLLRGRRRAEAETILAKVKSKLPDGDYMCELIDTGFDVRASRGQIHMDLTIGQQVLLGRPESTGRSKNTGYVILGFPPSSAKGSSGSPSFSETTKKKAATISFITPDPCTITQGQTVQVDIYGSGFTTAPTYSTSKLTNAVAPVVTATHITLQVQAANDTIPGDYDLIFEGGIRVGYFQVSGVVETLLAHQQYTGTSANPIDQFTLYTITELAEYRLRIEVNITALVNEANSPPSSGPYIDVDLHVVGGGLSGPVFNADMGTDIPHGGEAYVPSHIYAGEDIFTAEPGDFVPPGQIRPYMTISEEYGNSYSGGAYAADFWLYKRG